MMLQPGGQRGGVSGFWSPGSMPSDIAAFQGQGSVRHQFTYFGWFSWAAGSCAALIRLDLCSSDIGCSARLGAEPITEARGNCWKTSR